MDYKDYFENTEGIGVLATADTDYNVNLAIYARPHVIDENTLAFIMRQRLSHKNIKSTQRAAYMFIEKGSGYKGLRLYLTQIKEETNTSIVESFRRKEPMISKSSDDSNKYLVFFRIDDVRPLVGDNPPEIEESPVDA